MPRHDFTEPLDNNIRAGDVVLCVRGGPVVPMTYFPTDGFPVQGRFYTVESTAYYHFKEGIKFAVFLKDGPRNKKDPVWAAYRFIKVTPPSFMKEEFDSEPLIQKEKKVAEPV